MSGNAVLFVNDVGRMADFYAAIVPMERMHADAEHVVLRAGTFELVVHGLAPEIVRQWPVPDPPPVREDTYIKLAFTVASLADVRARITALGGALREPIAEWEGRGYRFCDGHDPEGNVIQFRERVTTTP